MASTTKKWLTGCGIGCGVVVLLAIIGTVGGSMFLMGPFRDAIATRETLDEQFGDQASYTPPVDGAVAADRLQAFLAVRAAIMELCGEFEETAAQFQRMDELDEDAPNREVMGEGLSLTKEIFGMVPRMGRLYAARNGTLAEVGMGLGEYTYIFAVAYADRINPESDGDEALFGDTVASSRVREILRAMLGRQLELVRAAEAQGGEFGELSDLLAAEVDLLEADHGRLPWQDGVPPALAASLAPFRERLDAGFCAATAGLELQKNQQRGLSIQGN